MIVVTMILMKVLAGLYAYLWVQVEAKLRENLVCNVFIIFLSRNSRVSAQVF